MKLLIFFALFGITIVICSKKPLKPLRFLKKSFSGNCFKELFSPWGFCTPDEEKGIIIANDWTKTQVAIYNAMNTHKIKERSKLPYPDCLGTLVSPNIVLTTAKCVFRQSQL